MKLLIGAALLVFLVATSPAPAGAPEVRVVAMAGGAPGNSLESFAATLGAGALYAEADFIETADGVLVAAHEPDVGGSCGVVSERTVDELRGCRLGTGETIATLADLLSLPFKGVWVDLKSDAIPAAVAEISRSGRRDVVLMVYRATPSDVALMREAGIRGGMKGYPTTAETIRALIDQAAGNGFESMCSEARWLTPDLVAYAESVGVTLLPWIHNATSEDHVRELFRTGVSGVIVQPTWPGYTGMGW